MKYMMTDIPCKYAEELYDQLSDLGERAEHITVSDFQSQSEYDALSERFDVVQDMLNFHIQNTFPELCSCVQYIDVHN